MEETEIDTAVTACLDMPRVAGEIGILSVLNYQPSVFFENSLNSQNNVRQSRELLQGIRWVGKDQVVLGVAGIEELKYIASYHAQVVNTELTAATDDPILLHVRDLNGGYRTSTTAHALDTDTSRACKQIEHVNALKVHAVIEQIEKALFGEVGCWPRGYIFRGRQSPPPICSANNPHRFR